MRSVAAGLLLGLDADRLRAAMSLAVSQAAGTFAAWPTTTVKFHQARGAAAGLLAARLAAEGFEAGREPFEAPDGGLFRELLPATPNSPCQISVAAGNWSRSPSAYGPARPPFRPRSPPCWPPASRSPRPTTS